MVLARLAPSSPPSLNRRGGGGGAFSRLLSCRQVAFILTCLYITCLVVAFWSISRLHSSHDVSFSSGFQMMNLEMILQELAGAPPIVASTATSTTTTSKTLRASSPAGRAPKEEVLAQAPPTSGILAQIDASLDAWYKPILVKMESSSVLANAKSCRRVSPSTDSREEFLYYYSLDPLAACRTTSSTTRRKKIIYFNPHARPRLVCGHEVPANGGTLELDQPCLDESSRLFPVIPSVETAGQLPPTTLRFNDPHKTTRVQPFPDCNIPCHSGGSFGVLGTRTVDGTPWKFHFSMEGAQYYSNLKIRELAHVENYFYSTTSFRSEVPLPYFSYAEYDIQNPNGIVDFHRAEKAAVFLARNCGSKSNREDLVKALQASPHFRVDSLSQCLHNAELPPGLDGLGNKNTVMHHYLFYLAFENQREEDYVTEKLWGPYEAGTVPVYYGAPNIKQLAPNRSYIDVDDFATPDDLARYLNTVANNQTLYESYHTWRREPLQPHFTAKFNISKTHSTCRTCRWAFAKMYGLGWSHENQTIVQGLQSTARSVCLVNRASSNNFVVTRPFREVWFDALTSQQVIPEPGGVGTDAACQEVNSQTRVLYLQHGRLKRTVWEQDGVVDFVLDYDQAAAAAAVARQDEGIQLQLRLETPLQGPVQLRHVRDGQIRLQNHDSRFTLLTWPALVVNITQHVAGNARNSASSLVVNLHHIATNPASSSFPLRLRMIVEDVDLFHKGADKMENYFGSLMIDDFFQPVEAFYRHEP